MVYIDHQDLAQYGFSESSLQTDLRQEPPDENND